jgi:hypothetical protein
MFEKEAEEYFRENAYNFDEVTACRECMEFGYNKANEWHYPSKGELPKEHCKRFLLCLNDKEINFGCYNGQFFTTLSSDYGKEEVYAWREIPVPPKEIE